MKDPLRHLPVVLVAFLILFVGLVDLAVGVERTALVTLLAPTLWLGWYFLGSDRAAREE
ncbi:MAG: hypothetical protein KGJ80_07035 [Chloroflexota bacterium]|nr:hypothetical protein [Chloroflexota bacterium]